MRDRISATLVFLVAAIALLGSAYSAEYPPRQCSKASKCDFVVFGNGTVFLKAPSKDSEVVVKARPAQSFLGDPEKLATRGEGWMQVFVPVQQQGEWRTQVAWVRREEVLVRGDFKKASACWPIQGMKIELGEYWAEITFSTWGSAQVNGTENDKAQVYFAENIFELRSLQKEPGAPILRGAINPNTGALDVTSVEGLKSHRTSSEESLKSCSRYPRSRDL